MNIKISTITINDDLDILVQQINCAPWDEEDDSETYSTESLRSYLSRQDTILITCHAVDGDKSVLTGMASARIEQKPYDQFKWLYVDEVDVCSVHRVKGFGTALMNRLMELAQENYCSEIWLAAETSNTVANKFYERLKPDDIGACIGYTFEP